MLASKGAHLVLCDIDRAGLIILEKELQGNHYPCETDVGRSDDCHHLVSSLTSAQELSRIDCLFNCAGINPKYCPLGDTTDEMWDQLMNANLRGIYNMTRACLPYFKPGSSIVNMSSMAGIQASAGLSIYNATKFGVIGFSKSMALELGPKGVRVNVVAPGPIDTPTNMAILQGREPMQGAEGETALGRMGKPEEVADAVCYLLSDKSSFVNGTVLEISGGAVQICCAARW